METAARDEGRPGTRTNEPSEGKRADAPDARVPDDLTEQPGMKEMPPVEGADDASGARRPNRENA